MISIYRVFVSSTFMDFQDERAAIRSIVVPRMQAYCAAFGASFEAVDLRWGVLEDEESRHGTLDLCLDEIRRCQALTPRPNFLVLLGDRYGWRPLPTRLANDLATLLEAEFHAADAIEAQAAFARWYRPDPELLNHGNRPAALPFRRLQPVLPGEEQFWRVDEAVMRTAIDLAIPRVADAVTQAERYGLAGSATHQEVLLGGLTGDAPPPLLAYRATGPTTSDTIPLSYATALREALLEKVPLVDQFRLGDLALLGVMDHGAALATFAEWAVARLQSHVDEQRAGQPAADALAAANARHCQFGAARIGTRLSAGRRDTFRGRGDELDHWSRHCAGAEASTLPVLLTAPGGTGKTAFAAAMAKRLAAETQPVIQRYVGATPKSLTAAGLLDEIGQALDSLPDGTLPIVLLDGLDQVPASVLPGLRRLQAAYPMTLIATARSDGPGVLLYQAWAAGGWTVADLLPEVDANAVLDSWTEAAEVPRRLLGERRAAMMLALGHKPKALAIRIAASLAGEPELPAGGRMLGIEDWVEQAMRRLERHLPAILVRRAAEYIALARTGLGERELGDLLAADPAVRLEFNWTARPEWQWSELGLPPILLSRFRGLAEPLLVEAAGEGPPLLRFLHREFDEAVLARLGADRPVLYSRLAGYFCGFLTASANLAEPGPTLRRALFEGPRALIRSGDVAAAELLFGQYSMLQGKLAAGMLEDLLADLEAAQALNARLQPLLDWFLDRTHLLRATANTGTFLQLALEAPETLPLRLSAERFLAGAGAGSRLLRDRTPATPPTLRVGLAEEQIYAWKLYPDTILGWTREGEQLDVLTLDRTTGRLLARFTHAQLPDDVAPVMPWWTGEPSMEAAGPGLFWSWQPVRQSKTRSGELRLWRVAEGGTLVARRDVAGLRAVLPVEGERLLTVTWDGVIALWDADGITKSDALPAWTGLVPEQSGECVLDGGIGLTFIRVADGPSMLLARGPDSRPVQLPLGRGADEIIVCGRFLVVIKPVRLHQDPEDWNTGRGGWMMFERNGPAARVYDRSTGAMLGVLAAHVAGRGPLAIVGGINSALDGTMVVWGALSEDDAEPGMRLRFGVVRCTDPFAAAESVAVPDDPPQHLLHQASGGIVFCTAGWLVFVPPGSGPAVRCQTAAAAKSGIGDAQAELLPGDRVASWRGVVGTGSADVEASPGDAVQLWSALGESVGALHFGAEIRRIAVDGTAILAALTEGTARLLGLEAAGELKQPYLGGGQLDADHFVLFRTGNLAEVRSLAADRIVNRFHYDGGFVSAAEVGEGEVELSVTGLYDDPSDVYYQIVTRHGLAGQPRPDPYPDPNPTSGLLGVHAGMRWRSEDAVCWGGALADLEDGDILLYDAWATHYVGRITLPGMTVRHLWSFSDGILLAVCDGHQIVQLTAATGIARLPDLPAGFVLQQCERETTGAVLIRGADDRWQRLPVAHGAWAPHTLTPDQAYALKHGPALRRGGQLVGPSTDPRIGVESVELALPPGCASPMPWISDLPVVHRQPSETGCLAVTWDGVIHHLILLHGADPDPATLLAARAWTNPIMQGGAEATIDDVTLFKAACDCHDRMREAHAPRSAAAWLSALDRWSLELRGPGNAPRPDVAAGLMAGALDPFAEAPLDVVATPAIAGLLARLAATLAQDGQQAPAVRAAAWAEDAVPAKPPVLDQAKWSETAATMASLLAGVDPERSSRLQAAATRLKPPQSWQRRAPRL